MKQQTQGVQNWSLFVCIAGAVGDTGDVVLDGDGEALLAR